MEGERIGGGEGRKEGNQEERGAKTVTAKQCECPFALPATTKQEGSHPPPASPLFHFILWMGKESIKSRRGVLGPKLLLATGCVKLGEKLRSSAFFG